MAKDNKVEEKVRTEVDSKSKIRGDKDIKERER